MNETPAPRLDCDVLIVGAGISGIAAAYHLQKTCADLSFEIVEARSEIGGTWNLFRYPGIRSDSDMFTLGFAFRPWKSSQAIATGPAILSYLKETAAEYGIDRKISFDRKVLAAAWSSEGAFWTVELRNAKTRETERRRCRFLFMCSGYYDYDEGYTPEFPGRSAFQGEFIHPQNWPADWNARHDLSGKKVVVIGSGATAVTLIPELAKVVGGVTLLQRTPSYVMAMPSRDGVAAFLERTLPERLTYRLIRWKNILLTMAFYNFCRKLPRLAKKLLFLGVRHSLGAGEETPKEFIPPYNPWEQRLCLAPDGDFFQALRSGRAKVLNGTIESFVEGGIRLASGETLPADVIVSATGLKLKFLAGVRLTVDGRAVNPSSLLPYKGAMLSGLPNLAMAFGYTNASWTLKAEMSCRWVAKVLRLMKDRGYRVVTPEPDPRVERVPLIDFSSGYFARAADVLPRHARRGVWRMNQNYLRDLVAFRMRPLRDRGLGFH